MPTSSHARPTGRPRIAIARIEDGNKKALRARWSSRASSPCAASGVAYLIAERPSGPAQALIRRRTINIDRRDRVASLPQP